MLFVVLITHKSARSENLITWMWFEIIFFKGHSPWQAITDVISLVNGARTHVLVFVVEENESQTEHNSNPKITQRQKYEMR